MGGQKMTTTRAWRVALVLSAALVSGCDSLPDSMNPGTWVSGTSDWLSGWWNTSSETGQGSAEPAPVPAAPAETPKLSDDTRPKTDSNTDKQKVVEGLVSDRTNAQYTQTEQEREGEATRPLDVEKPEAPQPAPQPVASTKMAEPPAAAPAPAAPAPAAAAQSTKIAQAQTPAAAPVPVPTPPAASAGNDNPNDTDSVVAPSARVKIAAPDMNPNSSNSTADSSNMPAPAPTPPAARPVAAVPAPAPAPQQMAAAAPPPPPPVARPVAAAPAPPPPAPAPMAAAPPPRPLVARPANGDLVGAVYRQRLAEFSAGDHAPNVQPAPPSPAMASDMGAEGSAPSAKVTAAHGTGGAHPLSALDQSKLAASFQVAEIVFGEGTSDLAPNEESALRAVAGVYNDSKGTAKIGIIGHSNSVRLDVSTAANQDSNRSLAAERAAAVARALERLGVPAAKIYAGATGETAGDYAEVFVAY